MSSWCVVWRAWLPAFSLCGGGVCCSGQSIDAADDPFCHQQCAEQDNQQPVVPEAAFQQFLLWLIDGLQQLCDAGDIPGFDEFSATLFGQLFEQSAITADIGEFC